MTEHRVARWLLFLLPIMFVAQYPVKRQFGEPYPAVIMPGFSSSKRQTSFNLPVLCILADGEVLEERPIDDLFLDIPRTSRETIVSNHLRPNSKVQQDARNWMLDRVKELHPGADGFVIRWYKHFYPPCAEERQWQGDLLLN